MAKRDTEGHRARGAFHLAEIARLRGEKDTPVQRKLDDLGALRIREMDEAGIDLQVISENNPATQNLDAETAVKLARASNDVLHEAVRAHPDRFAGFATLPTPDPKAAADELERAVTKLGFKGAMIMGLTHGRFMDDKQFRPDLRARRSARRAALYPPDAAASGGAGSLFQGISGAGRGAARLHPGDLDPHLPAHRQRPVR